MIAYYDLACCPVSYDVVSFLMMVERTRIQKGLDKVSIEILPGPQNGFRRDHLWPYSTEARVNMLNRVVIPMCAMLPSCDSVAPRTPGRPAEPKPDSIGWAQYSMAFKEFVDSYAQGIRPLRVSYEDIYHGMRIVTITLRESEHWPERNSNVEVWTHAATILGCMKDTMVVIVRDAAAVGGPALGSLGHAKVVVDEKASTNLLHRAKLYRSAHVNLFVNNGPAWLSMALDAPTIVFRPVGASDSKCWAHTPQAMAEAGIRPGQQMKGAPPHQMLSWVPETSYDIVNKVDEYFEYTRAARTVV